MMYMLSEETERALREHLRAHKAVLCRSHSFLHFIDFINGFHIQIINC